MDKPAPSHPRTVEMFGLCRAEVTAEMKIGRLEVFYDPATFLRVLLQEEHPRVLRAGRALIGDVTKTALERSREQDAIEKKEKIARKKDQDFSTML